MNDMMSDVGEAKKLLAIAYIFPPLARAGVHRTVRFVKYLPAMGWDITVLTADQRYYAADSPIDHELLNKIPSTVRVAATKTAQGTTTLLRAKESLRRLRNSLFQTGVEATTNGSVSQPGRTVMPAVPLHRATSDVGVLQRAKDLLYDLLTFPDKDVNWLPYAISRAVSLNRRQRFDLIYSTAPPFTDHLIGYILKKLTGLPWVADFRDPWARAPWKAEILDGTFRGRAAHQMERMFVESADRVILNTDWILREFTEYYGNQLARKFTVINNGFDLEDLPAQSHPRSRNNKLVITHTGALYRKRNPEHFLCACENLLRAGKLRSDDLLIRFVGGVASELNGIFERFKETQRVLEILPPVSHQEALQFQLDSDVLLILQPGTSVSIPGKIFEYIGMRRQILALTPPGATADVVNENQLGLVVEPNEVPAIERALLALVAAHRKGELEMTPANDAFSKFDGVQLTRRLHDELLSCLERG